MQGGGIKEKSTRQTGSIGTRNICGRNLVLAYSWFAALKKEIFTGFPSPVGLDLVQSLCFLC